MEVVLISVNLDTCDLFIRTKGVGKERTQNGRITDEFTDEIGVDRVRRKLNVKKYHSD